MNFGLAANYRAYPNQPPFLQEQGSDPNSPEAFKQNLQLVQEHAARLCALSRRALAGIKNAYHVGSNPSQTQEDIEAAKHTLSVLLDLMRQSGVGALPLLAADATGRTEVPTEAQLTERATKAVEFQFQKLKRTQESAAVVGNLLGADHRHRP